jgi:hypothetical protein
MTFSSSYSDGKTGQQQAMGVGKSEMTPEEIAASNKSMGVIPEFNYESTGMEYEVIGIENFNGRDCYVLKLNDGETVSFEYFDKNTFLKAGTVSIETEGEKTEEVTSTYEDYVEVNEIMFPSTIKIATGQANLDGKVVSRTINSEIDLTPYKK